MNLACVMLDMLGTALSDEERERLLHPRVAGVILFERNYQDPAQLTALVTAIHAVRTPPLLVAVDHEGGRIQRFRSGFTRLPAARSLGRIYDQDPIRGCALAEQAAWVMAAELRAVGVDFSFAPVLDLDDGVSDVIGTRAWHREPYAVTALTGAYIAGMRAAGMAACGKHFPGHGAVAADSHVELPRDPRPYATLVARDLMPYRHAIAAGLAAVMPAHVVYEHIDLAPAGFSRHWLKQVLRGELGFQGAVISDDLSMAGAAAAGDDVARAKAALAAGCDLLLVCNKPDAAAQVTLHLHASLDPATPSRLAALRGRVQPEHAALTQSARWQHATAALRGLEKDLAG